MDTMVAYILGAGASAHAGYPLASKLLHRLADWLDHCDVPDHQAGQWRNRIIQVRETFGALDDFESILGKLEEYGYSECRRRRRRPIGRMSLISLMTQTAATPTGQREGSIHNIFAVS